MQVSTQLKAWLPGGFAMLFIGTLVGGSLFALLNNTEALDFTLLWHDSYIHHVLGFTLYQASLSTLLSVGLAIPVAQALARRRFPGRTLLLRLFNLSLVMPVIIAVFGIVAVHGKNGWINQLLQLFQLDAGHYLYGLVGILLAHVFLNLPLATRLLLPALETIPAENWRLASQLGMSPWHIFRVLEWPQLRQQLPAVAGLIFMLCFTSFAVILALGGGPKSTTLEVAIYQALRFDFDLALAVLLALLQIGLTITLLLLFQRLSRPVPVTISQGSHIQRPDRHHLWTRIQDAFAFVLIGLLLAPPLLAVISSGFNQHLFSVWSDQRLWYATGLSLLIGGAAGMLSLLLGYGLLLTSRHLRWGFHVSSHSGKLAWLLETSGTLILVVPALVLGTGLFILLRTHVDVFQIAPLLVVFINALMALPYVLKVLGPPMHLSMQKYNKLSHSLGVKGWYRLRYVDWPQLRKPITHALAIAIVLSLGDLGVVALFGSQTLQTLPLLLYQRMGSYQLEAAAVTALWLLLLCLLVFTVIESMLAERGDSQD